jgi:hypothetical protein
MVTEIGLFESPDWTSLHFCFLGSLFRGEVYAWKVDTRYELLARMLDDGDRIKKREDQLRRTTRDCRTVAVNLMVGFSNIYFEL